MSKLKRRLQRLIWFYTCQNATLLEISRTCPNLIDDIYFISITRKPNDTNRHHLSHCSRVTQAIAVWPGLEVIKLEFFFRLKIKRHDWLLADTCPHAVRTQPIIGLYFDSETVLKFYNLEAWLCLLWFPPILALTNVWWPISALWIKNRFPG